jgi:hypothetical protein
MQRRIGAPDGAITHGLWTIAVLASLACGGSGGGEPMTIAPADTAGRTTTLDGRLTVPAGLKVT